MLYVSKVCISLWMSVPFNQCCSNYNLWRGIFKSLSDNSQLVQFVKIFINEWYRLYVEAVGKIYCKEAFECDRCLNCTFLIRLYIFFFSNRKRSPQEIQIFLHTPLSIVSSGYFCILCIYNLPILLKQEILSLRSLNNNAFCLRITLLLRIPKCHRSIKWRLLP